MKRMIAFFVTVTLLLGLCGSTACAKTSMGDVSHSVVRIEVGYSVSEPSGGGTAWIPQNRGSGFFVGKKDQNPVYLITNRHVISFYLDNGKGEVFGVTDEKSGQEYVARSHIRVYFDINDYEEAFLVETGDSSDRDIAILKLERPTGKRAPLEIQIPTEKLKTSSVLSFGFPGEAENELFKGTSSASEKDVVAEGGRFNKLTTMTGTGIPIIQHSATIHPGNSGGPLVLEENGAVIGVNTWSYSSERTNEPLYYAISMEFLKPYLDRNGISYTLVSGNEDKEAAEAKATPETTAPPKEEERPSPTVTKETVPEPVSKPDSQMIYIIMGAAIIAVIVVLTIVLRKKPKKNPAPGPETKTKTETDPKTGTAPVVQPVSKPAAPSSRILIGVTGPLKGKSFTLKAGEKILIGRDKSCAVRFPDGTPGVSNLHCEIRFDGKTAVITDLKSSYGTFVDHKKIDPAAPTVLHRSLAIDIGTEQNRFVLQ